MPTWSPSSGAQDIRSLSRRKTRSHQVVTIAAVTMRADAILVARRTLRSLHEHAEELKPAARLSAEALEQWLSVLREMRNWSDHALDCIGAAKRPAGTLKVPTKLSDYDAIMVDEIPTQNPIQEANGLSDGLASPTPDADVEPLSLGPSD